MNALQFLEQYAIIENIDEVLAVDPILELKWGAGKFAGENDRHLDLNKILTYYPDLLLNGILCRTLEYGTEIHSSAVAALGGFEQIKKRIWRGQVAMLLPAIDTIRLYVCDHLTENYGVDWPLFFPPKEPEELQSVKNNPRACQLGHLLYTIQNHYQFVKGKKYEGRAGTLMNQDILLCDLDAFFASVEQRDKPELKGKPLLVGGDAASRGVVSTCSYEARRYGVRSAMPMKIALQLCPEAVVLPVNMAVYKAVSGRVMEIFARFTPDIEQVSIDEAYLAVKEGTGWDTARQIRSAVQKELNLPLSIGVSANKLLAKIACSLAKPDGVRSLWPGEVEKALWPLPIKVLPGVGPVTEQKLRKFGIKTVGDIVSFPLNALENIAGSSAAHLKEYARGRDGRKLELRAERKSISEEITFPRDVYAGNFIRTVLLDLAAELGYCLRSKGIGARTISVKLRFPDLRVKTRSITLSEATDSDEKIYAAAADLFDRCCGKPPWRLIGIRVSKLEGGSQLSLFPEEGREKITPVLDMLRQKYGKNAVFRGRQLLLQKEDI